MENLEVRSFFCNILTISNFLCTSKELRTSFEVHMQQQLLNQFCKQRLLPSYVLLLQRRLRSYLHSLYPYYLQSELWAVSKMHCSHTPKLTVTGLLYLFSCASTQKLLALNKVDDRERLLLLASSTDGVKVSTFELDKFK